MNGTRPDKSKLYYPKMPATWWLRRRSYFFFMLRELSSVFIAVFLLVFLIQIYQLSHGLEAYVAFTRKLASPGWIAFHLVALLFALYHSLTWFYSTAVILPLQIGERKLPRGLVTALNIGAWIAVSLIIFVFFRALQS
ncbi:MAG TPA: hypothetical protein VGK99_05090 [Acidobacteriota bacterium]|jgi:fumarate reductase subunit C